MGKKMAKAGLFSLAALGAGAAVFMAGKKEKGCAKKCTAAKDPRLCDERRKGDGRPFRVSVGSVPQYPVIGGGRGVCAG